MKAIKFRAKTLDRFAPVWLEGMLGYNKEYDVHTICTDDGETHDVDDETICQFTGFVDNAKQPIYEGDILKRVRGHLPIFYQVYWSEEQGTLLCKSSTGDIDALAFLIPEKFVVVGNYIDHPSFMRTTL